MPYLRIICCVPDSDRFEMMAKRLTETINDLFYNSRARVSRDELRSHTTVHFVPFADREFFIGGISIYGKEMLSDRIPRIGQLAKRLFN